MKDESTNGRKAHAATDKSPDKTGETGSSAVSRGKSGRFLPGNRANPNGRPRGSLNQATLLARALLEENAPSLFRKAIDEAHAGNSIALKLCLERLMPIPQDRHIHVPIPTGGKTPTDILAAHSAVLRAVADGEITPHEGQSVSSIVEARRRSWESVELAERISALEDRADDLRSAGRTPHVVFTDDTANDDNK